MTARATGLAVGALLALAATGCRPMDPLRSTTQGDDGGLSSVSYLSASEVPEGGPERFGFGASASEARIAMWDIDVRPDGAGLPPGSGSVAEGRIVYNSQCIACHGPTGTEGPNDRLVDSEQWDDVPTTRTIGNYWPHATTLYDYIRKAMPQLTPGILTHDQVYAVIAYLLYMNEIVPEDAVMDANTLPAVVMPARDKFVVDDRVGGTGTVR